MHGCLQAKDGGQLESTSMIDNYPGFENGVDAVGMIRVGKLREERDMKRQLQEARRRDKDREKKKRQESFAKRKKQQARFQERFGALDSKTATLPAHFRRAQNSTTTKIHL